MIDIGVTGLVKSFDLEKKILDGLTFQIDTGERVGILGRNGAGKTTLISILSTLLLPSAGEIRIDGETLGRRRGDIKRKLALITQHNSLRSDMTLDQIMELPERTKDPASCTGSPRTQGNPCETSGSGEAKRICPRPDRRKYV